MPRAPLDVVDLAWRLFLVARCALYLLPWLARLFIADVVLSALLPLSLLLPTLCYDLSSAIAASVWRGIQALFTNVNGARIILAGDALPRGESAIVVCNHVEWSDFYMIQELAIQADMLGRCRWFAKQQLRWVPFLGWGLWAMGMPLVSRKWMQDKREMDRVFGGLLHRKWPMWLIAYSEATRFTLDKRDEAIAWAEKRGRTVPKHLLYPRTKGFIACVKHLRQAPHVKAVYDLTVAYAEGDRFQSPPSFTQSIMQPRLNERWKLLVHAKRFLLHELPHTDEELAKWLEDRWLEKGDLLEEYKEKLVRGDAWEEDLKRR